jgi:hypothetical protein
MKKSTPYIDTLIRKLFPKFCLKSGLKKGKGGGIYRLNYTLKEKCGFYTEFMKGILSYRFIRDTDSNWRDGAGSE